MKKILLIANDTTYTYNLRDVLMKLFITEGYEVIVVCECLNYEKEIRALGVRLVNLKVNRHSKNPFSDIFLIKQIAKIIMQEKPSMVLTYNIKPNVYGGIICKLYGINYIPNITGLGTSIKNKSFIQKISILLYKIGLSKATCVMFQNEDNRHYFIEKRILGKDIPTCLLPGSGVNLEKFIYQSYPKRNSPMIFSVIGRIMKDKGIDELIEAIRIVKKEHPEIIFRLIGYFDENYQSVISSAIRDRLFEYIEEQEDIRPFIKDTWAVIQPSHHEGMSNVLLESAATGRPVIATDIPGCREAFDNNISGFSFPVGNAKVLAEQIIRFIELPYEDKLQMGKAGRIKMECEFDRKIVAEAYMREIEKVEGK